MNRIVVSADAQDAFLPVCNQQIHRTTPVQQCPAGDWGYVHKDAHSGQLLVKDVSCIVMLTGLIACYFVLSSCYEASLDLCTSVKYMMYV